MIGTFKIRQRHSLYLGGTFTAHKTAANRIFYFNITQLPTFDDILPTESTFIYQGHRNKGFGLGYLALAPNPVTKHSDDFTERSNLQTNIHLPHGPLPW